MTALNVQTSADATRPVEHTRLHIGGEWVDALAGGELETVNPSTGAVFARVARAEAADVDRAVTAARAAFEEGPWPRMKPRERAAALWRLGDLILADAAEMARVETLDQGKPYAIAQAADVPSAAGLFHYMSGYATKIEGETIPISAPGEYHTYTRREPLGVVGLIVPWNFPLVITSWKVSPALAAGNTVVLKPAEATPLSALRLAHLALEAGIPPGVLNVVNGYGSAAGAALAAHPGVDKVSFTGSTATGRRNPRRGRQAGTSSGSRSSSVGRAPTSSSPTQTWRRRSPAPPTRSCSTPGRPALPAPGSTSTTACSTRSSAGWSSGPGRSGWATGSIQPVRSGRWPAASTSTG